MTNAFILRDLFEYFIKIMMQQTEKEALNNMIQGPSKCTIFGLQCKN